MFTEEALKMLANKRQSVYYIWVPRHFQITLVTDSGIIHWFGFHHRPSDDKLFAEYLITFSPATDVASSSY